MLSTAKYIKIQDIDQIETIRAPLVEVFRAMTTSKTIDEWGGGPARIQPRINGKYLLWDGEMTGTIKEYDFPRRLVYTLRELEWDSSYLDSLVAWDFRETPNGTELTLHHTGLPTPKVRQLHNEGWGDYYLGPLKAYLQKKFK